MGNGNGMTKGSPLVNINEYYFLEKKEEPDALNKIIDRHKPSDLTSDLLTHHTIIIGISFCFPRCADQQVRVPQVPGII
jgi:hypothetical protein